jgi:hypothetical protein
MAWILAPAINSLTTYAVSRNGFEQFHSLNAELDDDAVKAIMTDAVNRTYVFLSKLSNALGDTIVERLKEQDDVPNWDDPEDARLFG